MKDGKKHQKNKTVLTKTPLRKGSGTVPVRITDSKATNPATGNRHRQFCTTPSQSFSLFEGESNAIDSITPSDIVNKALNNASNSLPSGRVPKALGEYIPRDPEEEERNRGNFEFKNGNFPAAVKFYTKCLGLKVCSDHIVHSVYSK